MNRGEIPGKAGIPLSPAFGMFAGQVGNVFHRCAETGGTNHGAVRAG